MKAKIEIECETIGELTSHLYEAIRQIKKEAKKRKLEHSDEFEVSIVLEDDNCYGSHDIEILPETEFSPPQTTNNGTV
jgi:hypothetical protein